MRHLVARREHNFLSGMQAASRHVNGIRPAGFEHLRKGDSLIEREAPFNPVGRRDADRNGAVGRKGIPNRVEDFQRKAGAVLQRSPIFVCALIRKWRQERV
ncbi:hypothetical protein D3C87_1499620 [compost metagenome]